MKQLKDVNKEIVDKTVIPDEANRPERMEWLRELTMEEQTRYLELGVFSSRDISYLADLYG